MTVSKREDLDGLRGAARLPHQGPTSEAVALSNWSVWTAAINPPHKQVVAIIPCVGDVSGKAIVSCDDNYSGDIERKARLIAAAPQLLALAQQMLGAIDGGTIDSEEIAGDYESGIPPHRWHEQWAYYARAAIAKMEGRP